ncbi:MAG: insulinase family protein [Planctomycetes bacterium]|nr:insulinase family protein [Planctomycetota bacterium]
MQSTFVEHELPNGLRIVCEVMPRVSSAAIGFGARTGSRHEAPPEHGVSHFLEHMCFKGTAMRTCREINVGFDELGSIYNAFTSKEYTVYYGWVPSGRTAEQLELLADMMRPGLPAEGFETERKVILEEIAMGDDSFEHCVSDFLHRVVFDGHPLAHEILGEKESIETLPRDCMVQYHRQRYAADNMLLVAAGAVEPEAIFAAAGRHCGDWERSTNGDLSTSPPTLNLSGVHKKQVDKFQQQSVVLLFPSVQGVHPDEESIEAFTSLFGGGNSRCYWNIVQKGICTQAGGVWLAYEDCGMMALYADGEPERCDDMLAALREQAELVQREGFGADEVKRVKNKRRTQLALEGENPRTRFMHVMDDLVDRDAVRTSAARLAAVDAVNERTIAEHLERYPITGEGLLLSVGPRDWP